MSQNALLPLLLIASSLLPGLVIFFLPENAVRPRTVLNLTGAIAKLLLVAFMLWGVSRGESYAVSYPLLPGIDFSLRADPLALLFVSLSAVLWFLTTVYAIAYLEDAPNRARFFGFFSLCVTATVGVAMAGNLLTFLLFYELLTLSTYPLVVHRETPEARAAGNRYLVYTLCGGAALLLGTAWLYLETGTLTFAPRGFVAGSDTPAWALVTIFFLLVSGVGVKAALVPLHGWLPRAMVAPAPVSALLHAVAVVKAGAFGIVRIVYDVFGVEYAADLGVMDALAASAAITIIYGSLRALTQDDLKRRLAFSTVSQVSYIALGVAIVGPLASIGGLVHLVHQGLMKITLFFCAGNYAETLGLHKVSELDGVGRRMPLTTAAFSVGALGMIGLPPMAGFISKWYLGLGALEAGDTWAVVVLAGSSALNAAYFLPILHRAWFCPPAGDWPPLPAGARAETALALLVPPVLTALMVILAGLLAASPYSPQDWATLVVLREFYAP
ncbi:MAG: proton-conducting transporter membrane subunit [Halieaceae bacterium]|jgi:multicomponent Na+:H+ antiporter subunit D|nr:proton-conducting transporter membrane subunit [Halieaceae bacterium]